MAINRSVNVSGRPKKRYNKSVYRSFAMILQFGLNMLVPICMMTALGIFLDKKLGTTWIMVVFFFVGAAAGGQNVHRMAKQIYGCPQTEAKSRDAEKKAGECRQEKTAGIEEQKDVFKDK